MKINLTIFLMLFSQLLVAQNISISGHITGSDSISVAGAAVVIEGTTLGTIADKNGTYKIGKIKPGIYKMRVSFLGYETIEKIVDLTKSRADADFVLKASSMDLNEVVVTGTRSEKTLKNVPVLTQVISAKKILDLGITNVADALQSLVPGLNVSQLGTQTTVTMQGMDAKYILFLIDGERIAGEVNGDIDYSLLNLENIDHIEVIKGASSSLYGSNAIGGVINFITKKTTEPFDSKIYARYSKYNEFYGGGTIGLHNGILGSRTSFSYNRTDGYDLTPDTPHDWTQNPYSTFNISQKFEVSPTSDISIVPYLNFYQFERGNVSARPAHDLYHDFNAGVKGEYYFNKSSLDFSLYRDRYDTYSVLELVNNRKDLVAYDILQTARIQGNIHISDRNSLIAGAEYNYEDLFSQRIEGDKKNAGESVLYLQDDLSLFKKLEIVTGIRTSYHNKYGFNLAPKISLLYRQGPFNFRASAGTGYRSPSLKELYMYFDHFGDFYVIGNTQLKPESSKYLSGSVEFSKPWNNSSVTIYSNRLKNMITDELVPDSVQPTYQYQNISSASVYGVDLMSKQRITTGLWISEGYSYVESTDNLTGLQLYGATRHSGNIAADYMIRRKKYSISFQLLCKLMGKKFYDITSTGPPFDKPYNTLRLTVTQEYRWLRLSTGIDNIFNNIIPQNLDFISPGRRFFLGVNVDFGKIK